MATGCFYCDEHHEGREAIMFKVGDMKAGTLYLFKDQAHKGRCVLALGSHKKEPVSYTHLDVYKRQAVDRDMVIRDVMLLRKSGGKSGDFCREV